MLPPETIDRIVGLARNSCSSQKLGTTADGRHDVYAINGGEGGPEIRYEPVPRSPRNWTVFTLDDLIAVVVDWVTTDPNQPTVRTSPRPIVWHNDSQVVGILDDRDGRETVTLNLDRSRQLECLTLWGEGGWLDQRTFVTGLRITLKCPELAAKFRALKWDSGAVVDTNVQQGKDCLGRAIRAELANVADLPEDVTLCVPLYVNEGEKDCYSIRCAIDIDPAGQRFRMLPYPGEIEAAVQAHQEDIDSRLIAGLGSPLKTSVPVYFGQP